MHTLWAFWTSTIGKKAVMAVSGVIMVLYLLGHVSGNLLIFGGPQSINTYAHALHNQLLPLLWLARVVLIIALVLHVVGAYQLTVRDKLARPVNYAVKVPQASTWGSRTMRVGGVVIFAFLIFHLLHLTTGTVRPAPFREADDYGNLVGGFQVGWVVAVYLLSMVAVGLHLYHGDWAWFRTLGLSRPSPEPLRRTLAWVIAAFVFAGFSLIPVVILLGGLK